MKKISCQVNNHLNFCIAEKGRDYIRGFYGYGGKSDTCIPALNMAEAWREFRNYQAYLMIDQESTYAWIEWTVDSFQKGSPGFKNVNPVDSLIYLRIWIEGQKKGNTPPTR